MVAELSKNTRLQTLLNDAQDAGIMPSKKQHLLVSGGPDFPMTLFLSILLIFLDPNASFDSASNPDPIRGSIDPNPQVSEPPSKLALIGPGNFPDGPQSRAWGTPFSAQAWNVSQRNVSQGMLSTS